MARIIVTTDHGRTTLDERDVRPCHLDDQHQAVQLLERLAWALGDAEREIRRQPRRVVAITSYKDAVG